MSGGRFTPEIVNPYFEKKPSKQERGGSFNVMFPTEGRAEKRIRLSVPLEVSKLQYPNDTETTVTENISSIGARVLSWRPIEPNERLMIRFLGLNLRTQARVVYCERLRHGQFGVGLQFPRALHRQKSKGVFGVRVFLSVEKPEQTSCHFWSIETNGPKGFVLGVLR